MWSDVDWDKKRLHVNRQLRRVREKGLIFQELKTKTAQRVIFLGDAGILKLEHHRAIQEQQKLVAGSRWQDQNIVFPSTIGTPLGPRNLYRHFIKTTEKVGLPRIKFHDLRHTAATLMLKEGIHPKVVQERLGHSTVTLTLDVYSHVIPSMQEEVAEKLDGLLQ
jgi:integrase